MKINKITILYTLTILVVLIGISETLAWGASKSKKTEGDLASSKRTLKRRNAKTFNDEDVDFSDEVTNEEVGDFYDMNDDDDNSKYKVGNVDDWREFENEFRADELFTVLIPKKRSITFEQVVKRYAEDETKIYMQFNAFNMDDSELNINYVVFDEDGNSLMSKKKLSRHVVKVSPKRPTRYSFKQTNPTNQEAKVTVGIDCKQCGDDDLRDKFMNKENFKEKLQGLDKIQKDLGVYEMYLLKAKQRVYNVAERTENLDWQLILSCLLEMGLFIAVTAWQIMMMKNMMVKRRII